MSPEKIGINMWILLEDEFVEGIGGRADGPMPVRVLKFSDPDWIAIQADERTISIEGTDFESVVQKKMKKKPSRKILLKSDKIKKGRR